VLSARGEKKKGEKKVPRHITPTTREKKGVHKRKSFFSLPPLTFPLPLRIREGRKKKKKKKREEVRPEAH